jgi:hypothetical protein
VLAKVDAVRTSLADEGDRLAARSCPFTVEYNSRYLQLLWTLWQREGTSNVPEIKPGLQSLASNFTDRQLRYFENMRIILKSLLEK